MTCFAVAATLLSACAGPTSTPAARDASAEERHQACLSRMYQTRHRGAVNWHLYEACMAGRA